MSVPVAAGVLVYAKDLNRIAQFYVQVLGMAVQSQSADWVAMASPDLQLVVHQIPPGIAAHIRISAPPVRRADVALKFFATVPSIAAATAVVAALGGQVFDDAWQGEGLRACNAMDCEGNVFQLRESID